jgi:transcriptional antiterminator RfaH
MAYWTVAQLQPRREAVAEHFLEVAGYTVYCPRIRPPQRKSFSNGNSFTRPLFPGYAFVLLVNGWWSANKSPGVIRLVLDGATPARVPDSIIGELRARERGGVIHLPERVPAVGDRVRITRGVFRDQLGLYAGQAPYERVAVLLSLLGSQRRVELPKGDVEAVG